MIVKALFIDRDGTINEEREYVHKPEQFHLIDGAVDALKLLADNGIKIYIITNQAGIARGYYTEDDFIRITDYMEELFAKESVKIDGVFYCPHHPDGKVKKYAFKCSCRKPETGMINAVISENGFKPEEMILVGDRNSDIETGKKLKMKTYLVETGYGMEEKENTKADIIVPNLLAAVKDIVRDT